MVPHCTMIFINYVLNLLAEQTRCTVPEQDLIPFSMIIFIYGKTSRIVSGDADISLGYIYNIIYSVEYVIFILLNFTVVLQKLRKY